jgi:hypothetical protein
VVVTPVLRDALGVAKKMMTASPQQRREFVRNPRPFLREALPTLTDETIEHVFWESAEYSERVRDIGLWQPKVLPFLKKSGIEWLPNEPMGLTVGGTQVDVRPEHARFTVVNRNGLGSFSLLGLLGVGPLYISFEREPDPQDQPSG